MSLIDLTPAVTRMDRLIEGVSDDQLEAPTPCPDYSLGDLIEHVGGLAMAFTWAARKDLPEGAGRAPSGDAGRLEEGWRARIHADLVALAEAWKDPDAWTGMTAAGGVDLPGSDAGVVALDELVIHGWDVARASKQRYDCDEASLAVIHGFVSSLTEPELAEMRAGIFGPVVSVADDAPLLDQVIGLAGRDPEWRPSSG